MGRYTWDYIPNANFLGLNTWAYILKCKFPGTIYNKSINRTIYNLWIFKQSNYIQHFVLCKNVIVSSTDAFRVSSQFRLLKQKLIGLIKQWWPNNKMRNIDRFYMFLFKNAKDCYIQMTLRKYKNRRKFTIKYCPIHTSLLRRSWLAHQDSSAGCFAEFHTWPLVLVDRLRWPVPRLAADQRFVNPGL